jgi:hypothetical protein
MTDRDEAQTAKPVTIEEHLAEMDPELRAVH